ncbi:hypothetical protein EJ05DRAFT_496863 [Pseudovirgaria hyperparasitica]|uniref:SH3 domain-containing protein n=1 Tax=Pseudovirgaria hyperparasitica TaxID=470096 RepID=A0A6A6WGJ6_9PEZI|nr:uncharacterized protein EJ05DRAFT_496863 [Pseudovirgaria hyperparasitica]KAF2761982.1 hypothetical protein EJ05DRAFT_496863 [Pseudovirgaria hyperparasitica]
MKFSLIPLTTLLLPLLVHAQTQVTCAVTTAGATSRSCTSANTNQCRVKKTYALGENVTVYCYRWGDVVQNDSMWFQLISRDPYEYIPASWVKNCWGVSPCK